MGTEVISLQMPDAEGRVWVGFWWQLRPGEIICSVVSVIHSKPSENCVTLGKKEAESGKKILLEGFSLHATLQG